MRVLDRIDGPRDLDRLTYAELARLAQECRDTIVDTITRRGGHLASNLGIVELTLALHRAFQSPRDRLVWDTSNQCYTHKLVTGRRERFATIRTPGGLSGFAEPAESAHDTLAAGHAGTGLSYALGMSVALQDHPEEPYVVAIVGDGALTSGPSYEALNNIAQIRPPRFVIVLNDNGWSISENVGWLVDWSRRDRPERVWEELGLRYLGPVDGHDSPTLDGALRSARDLARDGGPVIVHVRTRKGRGYDLAEADPCRFHQPGTPSAIPGPTGRPTWSKVASQTLVRLMERDERIVAVTAAMLEGTTLGEVKKRFPDRVHDVGIAEEHAVIMAAGMARAGLRPVVAVYSTFLQRSFDQLIHDVCLPGLPVTLCIDRAGLVGDDGKTHHGVFDIAYTRCVPGMVVAAPRDENELQHLLYTAIHSGRPFAIRYPRGPALGTGLDPEPREIRIGQAEILRPGDAVTLVAYGSMVEVAGQAARALEGLGLACGVVNARFAKPLDVDLLRGLRSRRILTLEEHLASGGFGSAVMEAMHSGPETGCTVRVHAIPDVFVEHGPQASQRAAFGLDPAGVVTAVLEAFPDLRRRAASVGEAAVSTAAEDNGRGSAALETITW